MAASILLQGGTILVHGDEDVVDIVKGDLLIEDGKIVSIGQTSPETAPGQVIDCTGKLISPGFIDTHHHVWQSCLKGTHANETLLDYFWSGNFVNSLLSPNEVFISQLAGAMECVDSGTTTVVDHATVNYSPDHSTEAIRATIASGIRSIFAYCPTPRVASWKPEFQLESDMVPPWVMDTYEELARTNRFGPLGRVRLAFAFDGLWLPKEQLQPLFAKVRKSGPQLITSHSMNTASFGAPYAPTAVQNYISKGLLGPDVLLSHNNNPLSEDTKALLEAKASISSTPSTELQMGHGNPVCLDESFQAISSLGIDCHSACSAYIPGQMNLCLQWARARQHEKLERQGQWARSLDKSVQDVFNLGTIQGARSVNMESEIGSITVGKRADLVILDTLSPGMVIAAKRDPVAAIVLHSSVRDVEMVIVDGVVRKAKGHLQDVNVPTGIYATNNASDTKMSWEDVSTGVLKLAEEVEERKRTTIDPAIAEKGIIQAFYLNAAARVG